LGHEFVAGGVGEAEVGEEDVEGFGGKDFESGADGIGGADVIADEAEEAIECGGGIGIVFDEQKAQRGGMPSGGEARARSRRGEGRGRELEIESGTAVQGIGGGGEGGAAEEIEKLIDAADFEFDVAVDHGDEGVEVCGESGVGFEGGDGDENGRERGAEVVRKMSEEAEFRVVGVGVRGGRGWDAEGLEVGVRSVVGRAVGDVDEELDATEEVAGGIEDDGRANEDGAAGAIGAFDDDDFGGSGVFLAEGDGHGALRERDGGAVEAIDAPGAAPLVGAEGGLAAP
jgi:hypothetical protein